MHTHPNRATILPHGSLLDFTDFDKTAELTVDFSLQPSVKDLIESRGFPHTEVFGIEIDGNPSSFQAQVSDGAVIDIYSAETARKAHFEKLSKYPGDRPKKFVADVHLGKLARWLRLLGIDTRYSNSYSESELIELATGGRLLLTRDIELLKHGALKFGYWIRDRNPEQQVSEVLQRIGPDVPIRPFSRCLECNGRLEPVSLEVIREQVPPGVQEWCESYYQCDSCDKVYWPGTHYDDLVQKVKAIMDHN
ncbi:MAG: Mut7-C RNAse domain-containing protein [Balneolaceae bacterium]|nr:Mut7-C RNAse domain-containing protein [Balneolaceae bacterium]